MDGRSPSKACRASPAFLTGPEPGAKTVLGIGLVALLLAGLLGSCQTRPKETGPTPVKWDLLEHQPTTRVAFGHIEPGSATGRQHLREGWPAPVSDALATSDGLHAAGTSAEVQFYLLLPVDLTLVGRYRHQIKRRIRGQLSCNGLPVGEFELKQGSETFRIDLPERALRPGVNEFQIQLPGEVLPKILWQSFVLSPRAGQARREGERLVLPPHSRTDFYFPGGHSSTFQATLEPMESESHLELQFVTPSTSHVFRIDRAGDVQIALPSTADDQPCRLTLVGGSADLTLSRPAVIGKNSRPAGEKPAQPETSSGPPLVLLICLDTVRADAIGAYGRTPSPTPYLDQVDWLVFQSSLAQSGWTKPAVASVFTGRGVRQHGVLGFQDKISDQEITLAESLRQAGYRTVGFTANPWTIGKFGFSQGFDRYEPVQPVANAVVDRALEELDGKSSPLFMYLHLLDPHEPYEPPPQFRPRTSFPKAGTELFLIGMEGLMEKGVVLEKKVFEEVRSLYEGEVRYADQQLGRLLEHLKQQGLYDQALIVFYSDHGEEFGGHGRTRHGNSLYQELLRVPLLVKPPQGFSGAPRLDLDVQHIDILPTILGFTRAPVPPMVEGLDVCRADAAELEHRVAFSFLEFGADASVIGIDDNAWYRNYESAIGLGYKLHLRRADTSSVRRPKLQLFDLTRDPEEREDLAHLGPVQMGYLWARIESEMRRSQVGEKAPLDDARSVFRSLPYLR
jgi:arylsulfatase A-like enzyme